MNEDSESVINAVSKPVLPAENPTDILSHEDNGKEMCQSFTGKRIKGEVSICSTMKKCNLKALRIQGKIIKTKIGEKLVQLKEVRTLRSRFLITA